MSEFLIRLRATSNGIEDLAGNTITNNGSVSVVDDNDFQVSGKAIRFSGSNYLVVDLSQSYNFSSSDDYTISVFVKALQPTQYPVALVKYAAYGPGLAVGRAGSWIPYASFKNDGYATQCISSSAYSVSVVHHIALVKQGTTATIYIDGVATGTQTWLDNVDFGNKLCIGWDGMQSVTYFNGELDDIVIVDGALWTSNFTPPWNGVTLPSKFAFLSNNSLYTGASLTQLSNSWNTLTNAQKEALVPSFSDDMPAISNLATISPFRVLTDDTSSTNVKVTGQPKPQTIEPTSLINTGAVSTVQSINITNTITDTTVKFAITTDLTTYKVYDAIQGEWATSTDIEEDGMSIAQINALTPEMLALLNISNGIAFKQCFIGTSENASAELSEISAVVDIDGSWSQSVHGTDYNVTYPNKTTMSVRLLTNGDYIINYPVTNEANNGNGSEVIDANTLVLMHFDNNIEDVGKARVVWQAVGIDPTYSSIYKKFGSAMQANNTNNAKKYIKADSSFSINTHAFTVDFWLVYTDNNYGYQGLFGVVNESIRPHMLCYVRHDSFNSKFRYIIISVSGTSLIDIQSSSAILNGTHHIAIVGSGGVISIYIDGVLSSSQSGISEQTLSFSDFIIGMDSSQYNNYTNSYIDEFRISSIARWTSNFDPPVSPYGV